MAGFLRQMKLPRHLLAFYENNTTTSTLRKASPSMAISIAAVADARCESKTSLLAAIVWWCYSQWTEPAGSRVLCQSPRSIEISSSYRLIGCITPLEMLVSDRLYPATVESVGKAKKKLPR
jgi:hypothetical protein